MAISSSLSSISWGGTTIAAVGSVTINLDRPALDTTPIGAGNAEFIAGLQNTTATLDIFYDQGSAAHTTLESAINAGSASASVVLTLATGMTYTGNAYVTSFSITAQAGSVVRATVGLQYTGAITIA